MPSVPVATCVCVCPRLTELVIDHTAFDPSFAIKCYNKEVMTLFMVDVTGVACQFR